MKKTRLIAMLCCLVMLSAVFVSCTNETGSTDTTPAQTNARVEDDSYEKDSIPSGLNYNKDITILARDDYTMQEFESEDRFAGQDVDSAIFSRNVAVENRLGVTISYDYYTDGANDMAKFSDRVELDQASSKPTYGIYASYSRTGSRLATRGLTANLYDCNNINLDKPWWPDSLVDGLTVANQLYFCSGDISTNMLWMMEATCYNKSILAKYSDLRDPCDLVMEGEWTFDVMIEMCEGKYQSVDGSNSKNKADTYGMTLYQLNVDAYQTSAGLLAVINDDEQGFVLSSDFAGDKIVSLISKLQNWVKSNDVYHVSSTAARTIFFEQRSLFITDRVFIISGKDNSVNQDRIDFEYGIVPNPKYDKTQRDYLTNLGHPFTVYSIADSDKISDEDFQMYGTILECLASESYRKVTPIVYETAMKVKYAHGEEQSYMFDLIRYGIRFEIGRLFLINNDTYLSNAFKNMVFSADNTWKSTYSGVEESLKRGIAELNRELFGITAQ